MSLDAIALRKLSVLGQLNAHDLKTENERPYYRGLVYKQQRAPNKPDMRSMMRSFPF